MSEREILELADRFFAAILAGRPRSRARDLRARRAHLAQQRPDHAGRRAEPGGARLGDEEHLGPALRRDPPPRDAVRASCSSTFCAAPRRTGSRSRFPRASCARFRTDGSRASTSISTPRRSRRCWASRRERPRDLREQGRALLGRAHAEAFEVRPRELDVREQPGGILVEVQERGALAVEACRGSSPSATRVGAASRAGPRADRAPRFPRASRRRF